MLDVVQHGVWADSCIHSISVESMCYPGSMLVYPGSESIPLLCIETTNICCDCCSRDSRGQTFDDQGFFVNRSATLAVGILQENSFADVTLSLYVYIYICLSVSGVSPDLQNLEST